MVELMTANQILGFEPTARLEKIAEEQGERAAERKHRLTIIRRF
jgi:hypothetical protein